MISMKLFVLACLLKAAFAPHSACENFSTFGSHQFETTSICYIYYTTLLPKGDAEEECSSTGMQIVMFETTTEQDWLQSQLASNSLYYTLWTGGMRQGGQWEWHDRNSGLTMGTIDTSRILNPSSSDDHLILDPGPNRFTPRNEGTFHRFICETKVQLPTTPTEPHTTGQLPTTPTEPHTTGQLPTTPTEPQTTGQILTESVTQTTKTDITTIPDGDTTSTSISQTSSLTETTSETAAMSNTSPSVSTNILSGTTTTSLPATSSLGNPVFRTFSRVFLPVHHMRSLINDTVTSSIDCVIKCSALADCDMVEMVQQYCNLLQLSPTWPNTGCIAPTMMCYTVA